VDGISFPGTYDLPQNVVIAGNFMGQGQGVHLRLGPSVDASKFFLLQNTYFNPSLTPVPNPVISPLGAPVYIKY
jgi:hypothetical protein